MFAAFWLCAIALAMTGAPAYADADGGGEAQTVLHVLDYVGADYAGAVEAGKVKSADEYKEMVEFTTEAVKLIKALPANPQRAGLVAEAEKLANRVRAKAEPTEIAATAGKLRWAVIGAYGVAVSPKTVPDLSTGANLYQSMCASCHGAKGAGDGPAGARLDPAPANFQDADRMARRSVYGLYNSITLGVKGTAMTSFAQLSDDRRWALAFHIAGIPAAADRLGGEKLWRDGKGRDAFSGLANLATLSAAEVKERYGEDAVAIRSYLVTQPDVAARDKPSPVLFAQKKLGEALEAYRKGDPAAAQQLAVQAYIEGYELIEASLANVDGELTREGERNMMAVREAIGARAPLEQVEARVKNATETLERARERLDAGTLSPAAVFTSSLVILLREGLEALLVVAAIIAFLTKAGRRDALRWVHAGWIGAVVLGLATWAVASYAIDISGTQREVTEGITGLIAAAMLVYVGFWLHNKASMHAWQSFIKDTMGSALASRTLWTMASVSFIAVYREMFETVLFYQALWVQASEGARGAFVGGLAAAVASLAAVGWGIFRYSLRLPLGPFFTAMSWLMCALAVVLAGKGVAALQESGHVAATSVRFIELPQLGIFPTAESLAAQLATLAVIGVGFFLASRGSRAARPAVPAHEQRP
jgi:high-affinity iron transporter